MSIDISRVINNMRFAVTANSVQQRQGSPDWQSAAQRVVNADRYVVASFEDYSINWVDYTFGYFDDD